VGSPLPPACLPPRQWRPAGRVSLAEDTPTKALLVATLEHLPGLTLRRMQYAIVIPHNLPAVLLSPGRPLLRRRGL